MDDYYILSMPDKTVTLAKEDRHNVVLSQGTKDEMEQLLMLCKYNPKTGKYHVPLIDDGCHKDCPVRFFNSLLELNRAMCVTLIQLRLMEVEHDI